VSNQKINDMPIYIDQSPEQQELMPTSSSNGIISMWEYAKGWYDFNMFFRDGNFNSLGQRLLLPWNVFSAWVTKECSDNGIPADRAVVCFFHGMRNGNLVTGLSVISAGATLVRGVNISIPTGNTPSHEITPSGSTVTQNGTVVPTHVIAPVSSWTSERQSYMSSVRAHKSPALPSTLNFQPLDGNDPLIVMFPWELEIKILAQQNSANANSYLVISDFCPFVSPGNRPTVFQAEYYHSKSLHIAQLSGTVMVDRLAPMNSATLVQFTNNGLDYGNLCPPLCDAVKF
jgi:hypothetical protein